MDNTKHRRLQELDHSDFEIVQGEPDIRGWDVRNSAGLKVGEVEELIVDAQQKKVRYMVVDLDDNELKLKHQKVLLPIGLAELHKEADDVILSSVNVDQLSVLPAYDKDNLDEETERRICTALGRQTIVPNITAKTTGHTIEKNSTHNDDFYQHEHFHDDNLYKNRLHEAGSGTKTGDSEYEKGLRLWELRSEGGVVGSEKQHNDALSTERRMEMVQNRRKSYEERRLTTRHNNQHDRHITNDGHTDNDDQYDDQRNYRQEQTRDNTIVGRIRDEGLRDA